MPNIVEVGQNVLGGPEQLGLSSLSSGVATAVSIGKGEFYYAEETITLSGSGSTAGTSSLIQANSLILCCGAQVGTALTGATTVSVVATSDTTNSVLVTGFTTYTAGYNAPMGAPWLASNSNAASGPFFTAASTVTVKYTGATPAGTVKVWVVGVKFTSPS
jgi:hypothetical protein